MACADLDRSAAFAQHTRATFLQHLSENPNNRRISPIDKDVLIGWLTNPHQRPETQEEYSRRNYVRKTFFWNEESQTLLEIAKHGEDKARSVVTTDMIADIVEMVHRDNGHAGWDATWKDVSTSFYGILRADVIFLLKQCQTCSQNPSKRPKGSATMMLPPGQPDHRSIDCLNLHDAQDNYGSRDMLEDDGKENTPNFDNFVDGLDERMESTLENGP